MYYIRQLFENSNLKWQSLAKNQDDWEQYLQTKQKLETFVNAELIVS